MAVVHFATRGLIPVKPWTVPGGISSLDVPDRIVGGGSCILRRTACAAAQPPSDQEQKKGETNGNEGETGQATWKAGGRASGSPWLPPPADYPRARLSPRNPPLLHSLT